MKTYAVKEMFYTLQGEGGNTGRPAVFCRFAGCNLWSGRELDRLSAICNFCDTDFVGADAGRFTAYDLADACSALWPGGARLSEAGTRPLVVLTGGEPMLQVDTRLVSSLQSRNFEVAVETNGTIPVPPLMDWVTVSPKAGAEVVQRSGQELKLVFPHALDPEEFAGWDFERFYLQPMSGPGLRPNCQATVAYCLANPRWRLSLQTHKTLGLR